MAVQTFYPTIEKTIPYDVGRHLQLIYSKLNNHAQAFDHLVTVKIGGATTGETLQQIISKSVGTTINQNITTSGLPGSGLVNDQSGLARTSYTTQQLDAGALIILGNPAPVAVTLSTAVTVPWAAFVVNDGAGTVILTPQTGTITYPGNAGAASMALPYGYWAMVGFDGTNFWGALQSLSLVCAYKAVTANYSIVAGNQQIEATANSFTVTLPSATGIAGTTYSIKNSGTGVITVATTSAQTIDGSTTQALTQYDNLTAMSNGTNWIVI